jgi:Lsr2
VRHRRGTVRFGLDGTDFEIDLNARHVQALRGVLAPYVSAARRGPGLRVPHRGMRGCPPGLDERDKRRGLDSDGRRIAARFQHAGHQRPLAEPVGVRCVTHRLGCPVT